MKVLQGRVGFPEPQKCQFSHFHHYSGSFLIFGVLKFVDSEFSKLPRISLESTLVLEVCRFSLLFFNVLRFCGLPNE